MNRIVECVPNFSEGRRPEVIDAIVRAMTEVAGVIVLDREMDADHNRAVVTIIGPPESIGEAAVRGVSTAARHIDLTHHRGEHPRIGATDVLPFIPIRGVRLDECVAIARTAGQRIAGELHIPVYLYEAAATRAERVNLENIRRGGFEFLKTEIASNLNRYPDFGRPAIHPTAGAIAIGARKALIAYNINLHTPDVHIAKQIARRIRSSNGGLPCLKAMGVFLKDRNQAQVSMNLTDYEQTPIALAFDAVQRAAAQLGVEVAGSEIVGLVPQRALDQAAEYFLKIERFKPSMILENRIAETLSSAEGRNGESIRGFVERVASATSGRSGGSVSALSGALGAALGEMAIRQTADLDEQKEKAERCTEALDRLAPYTSALLDLIDAGPNGSGLLTAEQDSLIRATEISARAANCSAEALRILEAMRPIVTVGSAPDLQAGLGLLRASLRGAIAAVMGNLVQIADPALRLRYEDMITGWQQHLKG